MHAFHFRDGKLFCEDVEVARAAERFGTPLYLYSANTILDHYRRLDEGLRDLDHLICYAVKANSNGAILKLLADAGAGFDIVSGGELFRVRKAGGEARLCTFAGVGKSREEIEQALAERIYSFNVESGAELECINAVAAANNVRAPVALRINPDVDPHTHEYVSTGSQESKFGIALGEATRVYERASRMANIRLVGVQMHIGSQITEAAPFAESIRKTAGLVHELKRKFAIEFFSVGGGLGIVYQSSMASGDGEWWRSGERQALSIQEYLEAILPVLRELPVKILLEPGRLLVGNAGVLLTRVRYIKTTAGKKFVIVDAGMNDLIRPALYGSYHEIVPAEQSSGATVAADVVGPVCESGDFFAQGRPVPAGLREGDLLAIMSAGAYGFAMASNYNSRPFPVEAMVREDKVALIRKRQTVRQLVEDEVSFN